MIDIAAIKARAAEIIHSAMRFERMNDTPVWVGGNSFAEDAARKTAGMIEELYIAALEASEAARVKAEQALWELDAVGCDFGYYEQAAKTMKSIVDKAIDGLLKQPSILTSTEQKAQGKRCSCGGADDYCVCQNSPDKTTISKRITALEQERDALKEELRHIVEMTDADNPESYRADDREGCLDTVYETASKALEASK